MKIKLNKGQGILKKKLLTPIRVYQSRILKIHKNFEIFHIQKFFDILGSKITEIKKKLHLIKVRKNRSFIPLNCQDHGSFCQII